VVRLNRGITVIAGYPLVFELGPRFADLRARLLAAGMAEQVMQMLFIFRTI